MFSKSCTIELYIPLGDGFVTVDEHNGEVGYDVIAADESEMY